MPYINMCITRTGLQQELMERARALSSMDGTAAELATTLYGTQAAPSLAEQLPIRAPYFRSL